MMRQGETLRESFFFVLFFVSIFQDELWETSKICYFRTNQRRAFGFYSLPWLTRVFSHRIDLVTCFLKTNKNFRRNLFTWKRGLGVLFRSVIGRAGVSVGIGCLVVFGTKLVWGGRESVGWGLEQRWYLCSGLELLPGLAFVRVSTFVALGFVSSFCGVFLCVEVKMKKLRR